MALENRRVYENDLLLHIPMRDHLSYILPIRKILLKNRGVESGW